MKKNEKITDFLKTKSSKKNLDIALSVIREFKDCESNYESMATPFMAWSKLEQLEGLLEQLVEDKK